MELYQHKVQYYETDKMGIVHHSNYIRWMEEARIDFLHQAGCDFAEMEALGIGSPVVSVECKYKSPTMFGEVITIAVHLDNFRGGAKLKMSYEMKRDDTVVCTGRTEHGFFNAEGRLISLKMEYPEIYERLMAFAEQEI